MWNKIADLNVARDCAACTVFEGKIVVTGGKSSWYQLRSVEAYDYKEKKWTFLPDMIEKESIMLQLVMVINFLLLVEYILQVV